MTVLNTSINPHDPQFISNTESMKDLVDDLKSKVSAICLGGGEVYKNRHESRGKLFVRDRIDILLDENSFLKNLGICPIIKLILINENNLKYGTKKTTLYFLINLPTQ